MKKVEISKTNIAIKRTYFLNKIKYDPDGRKDFYLKKTGINAHWVMPYNSPN